MKKILIAPSILSADYCKLGEEIKDLLRAGCDMIHFDVMDNHYVPNLTIGPLVLRSIKKNNINILIDVHIMASPVDDLVISFAKLGANFITIHPESTKNLKKTLLLIKKFGCYVGLALSPSTSVSILYDFIEYLDLILIMTVNPGFGGQDFLSCIVNKIFQVREIINYNKKHVFLEVDGGINKTNISNVVFAGADIIVMGSAIFNSKNYINAIANFRKIISNSL